MDSKLVLTGSLWFQHPYPMGRPARRSQTTHEPTFTKRRLQTDNRPDVDNDCAFGGLPLASRVPSNAAQVAPRFPIRSRRRAWRPGRQSPARHRPPSARLHMYMYYIYIYIYTHIHMYIYIYIYMRGSARRRRRRRRQQQRQGVAAALAAVAGELFLILLETP